VSKRKKKSSSESSISEAIKDLLNKIDEVINKMLSPARDISDIVVIFVLLMLLLQSRTSNYQIPQHPIMVPPPKRQFTVSEIEQIIKQCERSANPLECIKNMIYGG
jgi:hypothetical protein